MEKKTKIFLNYLSKDEKEKMTGAMPFLTHGGTNGKKDLLDMANDLYGGDRQLDPQWDNGHYPSEYRCNHCDDMHFLTVVQFEKGHLTEQALGLFGETDSSDWPYYYAISLRREDRRLYAVSFEDRCSPNWNDEYRVIKWHPLEEVTIPLLKEGCTIYRMDDALHGAVNARLAQKRPLFWQTDKEVHLTVNDQHGNYTEIVGETLEQVLRDYADNYTGYRNFRRQMASEWVITDERVRRQYEAWKEDAKGLKSDFDKFYGGGIVD